ncbi:MAG: DinB family protein [Ectobacillus sp.]
MEELRSLFSYHRWATAKLLKHLCQLPESIVFQEIQSVFPSIIKTLEHVYDVDVLWFSRIKGTPIVSNISFSSINEAKEKFGALHEEMELFYEKINGFDKVAYSNSAGEMFVNTAKELVQHIVNHGTYHRGNITAMLWQTGQRGASTDYIFYLRESELPRT